MKSPSKARTVKVSEPVEPYGVNLSDARAGLSGLVKGLASGVVPLLVHGKVAAYLVAPEHFRQLNSKASGANSKRRAIRGSASASGDLTKAISAVRSELQASVLGRHRG